MLEIAQVVRSDAFAGVERYVCLVSNALSERGHHVNVVGGEPERMRHELRDEIDHAAADSTSRVFRALVRRRRVDVVHVHMTAAELAAVAARPWHRAPLVSTRHFPDRRGRRLPWLVSRVLRRALAEQIAISGYVAGMIGEPSVLIYNGVPERDPVPLEAPMLLMMQRLEPEKDPALGLRAWAESGLANSGWRLTVAGDGQLQGALCSLAKELGVSSSVSFLGRVTKTDALLETSSILLAAAPAEPFGLTVVEAMAHGVPVVAANGGAHRETVGGEGLLFAPGDAAAASEHLVALAKDPMRRRAEGERLRRRQQSLFSLDRHVDALEGVYSAVVRTQH